MTDLPVMTYQHISDEMERELEKAGSNISPAYRLLLRQTYRSFGHAVETLKREGIPPTEIFEILPGLYVSMTVMFMTAVFKTGDRADAEAMAYAIAEQTAEYTAAGFDGMWPTDGQPH